MSRSHGLLRISERIFNTPQNMMPETFERLTQYVVDRNSGDLSWQVEVNELSKSAQEKDDLGEAKILALNPLKASSFKRPDFQSIPEADRERAYAEYLDFIQYDPATKLGVLNIEGTTVYRSTPFEAMCGMTSYQRLERTLKAQIYEGAEKVLMYVDSGGGEAYGNFETARNLRSLADKAGVNLVAYVDGVSGSAAYALTSVAHEVIANPSARVGSIGVVVSLMNDSKKLEKEGLERVYLYRGDNKVGLDKDGNFQKGFIDYIENLLDESYANFTNHVASYRPMSVSDVVDTQASVYTAQKALSLGLVDKIMERDAFFSNYLLLGSQPTNNTMAAVIQPIEEKSNMDIQDITAKAGAGADPVVAEADVVIEGAALVATEEAKTTEDFATELAGVQANLQELAGKIEAKDSEIADLVARAELAEKALADYQHEAMVDERKVKLSSVMPSDRVDASLALATKLSAEDFNTYFTSLEASYQASKESMTEKGVKAEDNAPAEDFNAILSKSIAKANGTTV
jgi:ClpP class serine protease